MSTEVLGDYTFSNPPTILGDVMLSSKGGVTNVSSGVEASRPAAGNTGAVYLATDTQRVYFDDGVTWDVMSNGKDITTYQCLYSTVAEVIGTTVIADVNTVPTIANGVQVWTQTITPTKSTTRIILRGDVFVDHATASRKVVFAVFRGSVCIGVVTQTMSGAGQGRQISINLVDLPASTAAQTYSIRCWANGSGNWYVARASTSLYGGMLATASTMIVTEVE